MLVLSISLVPMSIASSQRVEDSDVKVVQMLNEAYVGFDPNNDTSPLGVFLHVFDGQAEQSSSEPYLTKCKHCSLFEYSSECRVSSTILNKATGFMQDDWVFKKSMCKVLPQFCNITINIWPGWGPPKGHFYATSGMIYAGTVPESATKCAYAFDSSSDMRPNRGCGCSIYKPDCYPDDPNWPCPYEQYPNACRDQDPLSKLNKINASSAVVTACQCARMGVNESMNPRWQGPNSTNPTVKCLWQGPNLFHGTGHNEIRRALRQQLSFVKNASEPHNEVILDGEALNAAIDKEPSSAISAFFYPLTPECEAINCSDAAYKVRHNYQVIIIIIITVFTRCIIMS